MSGPDISTDEAPDHALTRRSLLKTMAFAAGASLFSGGLFYAVSSRISDKRFSGAIVGASSQAGHLLREERISEPDSDEQVETVIVGGGIAGLSAAWWLKKNGYSNFLLLELEPEVGGNSQSGRNPVSAYPWGAHYVPLPGPDAHLVRLLFEELGIIRGYESNDAPIYNELYLCAEPSERLFLQGRWHEGLVPNAGLSQDEHREHGEFFAAMERYKSALGSDGKRAFSIPLDMSSQDPAFTELDRISMKEYMLSRGWSSSSLHWYVRYCCRDDYGVGHHKVSAWAGIHYFACRNGKAANADPQTVVTWPEGNGWIVSRLRENLPERIRENSLVYGIRADDHGASVDYLDVTTRQRKRLRCKRVVFAAPRFVASRIITGASAKELMPNSDLQYAPWLVANVTLQSSPGGTGAPLAWDNVSYYSESLGYIVATHQDISLFPKETVVTYYRPLDEQDPVAARKAAIVKKHGEWAKMVAEDLEKMHPGLKEQISNIDVWLWGHGMASPGIDFLWGEARQKMRAPYRSVHFAHSDMSGISTFEEAQYRGVLAADAVLEALGLHRTAIA